MKFQFEDFEHDRSVSDCDLTPGKATDSFELLSAYIDGELPPLERNRVQTWIDRDPRAKNLYTQLLSLQGQMQSLDAPPARASADEIAERVFKSVERRRRRRLWLGGSAIAASVLATMTGMIPGITPAGLRLARTPHVEHTAPSSLMLAVAVNKPAINIPKPINGFAPERLLLQERQL